MRILIRTLLMIAVMVAAAACAEPQQQEPTTTLPVEITPTAGVATEPGLPTDTSAAPAPGGDAQLTNRTWTWVRTEMNDGSVIEPRNPEEFTITLADNGQVTGTTDCNDFTGTYTTGEGGLLSFEPFVSTMMLCENSQETDFVSRLQEVQSYMFNEGQLVLLIKMDSGSITFR